MILALARSTLSSVAPALPVRKETLDLHRDRVVRPQPESVSEGSPPGYGPSDAPPSEP